MRPARYTQIESLEPRIAPASLSGTLSNGTLKIAAVGAATAVAGVLVQLDADSFDLIDTSTNTTTHYDAVRKVQAALSGVADNFKIVLAPGSESRVTFSINSGTGNDQIGVEGGGATWGDFSLVSQGATGAIFSQNTSLRGDVKVSTVNGFLSSTANLGNLSLTGASVVQLGGTVAGYVRISQSAGGIDVDASGTIHGDLSVTGGAGGADLALTGATSGKIRLNGSLGTAVLNTSGDFFAGSSLTVVGGVTTPDTVNIGFSAPDPFTSRIHGPVVLALGGGDNHVTINPNGRISGYLRVSTGDQNDTVTLGGFMHLGGQLQLALGGGTNATTISGLHVAGGLKYAGGAGADSLSLQNTSVLAVARFAFGDGTSTFSGTVSTFSNGLSIKGGVDNDSVFLGGASVFGRATFALGDGTNQFLATATSLRGGFAYQGGAGNDTVTIESTNLLTGTATVKGGDGANAFLLQGISFLTSVNYTGGIGADAFIYGAATPGFARVRASLGDGADFARIEAATFRSLTVDGGAGADSIERLAAVVTAGLIELNFETKTTF